MPLRLEIKKKLTSRSDRVKSVEIHPTETWVLTALYNGHVYIWDYESQALSKTFDICEPPIRCAKFIVRKQWFACASDDFFIRVYNYNTMEKLKAWSAHTDYIRYLEVHPSLPYLLSSSDDLSIKIWNWERNWECSYTCNGHIHYVMMTRINSKDANTFASASLDKTLKFWSLGTVTPNYSLEGHEAGVNCLDFYSGSDKPYLLSGADDATVKIWDYQTKTCVQTLSGHTDNICSVLFHPRLPIIVSASEDGTVRLWHSTTYRPETTLNYGMKRAWALAAVGDSNKLAIGFDEGLIVLQLGHDIPIASLDNHTGKVLWAMNSNEISTASLKGITKEMDIKDSERIPLGAKDLGSCDIFPQSLKHNCNGRFIVVCGDGEYIIYTSQTLRNKSYGSALDFVWSSLETGDYAVRESTSRVKIFKSFAEHKVLKLPIASAEGIYGGFALGIRGGDESILFYEWDQGMFIRKIDVVPKDIYWNETGELIAIICEEVGYILRYDRDLVLAALSSGGVPEDGIEGSFELLYELSDKVQTGQWIGDCFVYTTSSGRMNYFVGGQIMTLAHLEQPLFILGYLAREDRIFLIDKSYNVTSYKLSVSVLQYQTAVVRKDFETANSILPSIPQSEYNNIAAFLESQGFREEALAVTQDLDQKFDLALDLNKINIALEILDNMKEEEKETTDAQQKWKRLSDLALAYGNIPLAEKCALNASDLSGLLLMYSSSGNGNGTYKLGLKAKEEGKTNIAFISFFLLGRVEECVDLLIETERISEAAFLARTYMPSQIDRIMDLWKNDLAKVSERASKALANPSEYPNLFPEFDWALKVEELFKQQRNQFVPASLYPQAKTDLDLNLIELIKSQAKNFQELSQKPPENSSPVVNQQNQTVMAVEEHQTISQQKDEVQVDHEVQVDDEEDELAAELAQLTTRMTSPENVPGNVDELNLDENDW